MARTLAVVLAVSWLGCASDDGTALDDGVAVGPDATVDDGSTADGSADAGRPIALDEPHGGEVPPAGATASPLEPADAGSVDAGAPPEGSTVAIPGSAVAATAGELAAIAPRARARVLRAALRRPARLGGAARIDVDGASVYQVGFPAIDRAGNVVAYVDRMTDLCGEGVIELVDARSGAHLESIQLPVHGSMLDADWDEADCAVDRRQVRRINRRLARAGFRALPPARVLFVAAAEWHVGNGLAVRVDPEEHGVSVQTYDARSGVALAAQRYDDPPDVAVIPGTDRLVLSHTGCGCTCGYANEIVPSR